MKVLVVDDHPIVRAGLRRLLAGEATLELREAVDGKEAIAALREFRPRLSILDLNLPGGGGFELIRRFKREDPALAILVFSMHDDPLYAMRALQAGAAGYVSKQAPPQQILEGIARVARGQSYVAPDLAQALALQAARAPAHPLSGLSTRDLEIMRLLGEGRSLAQIAAALSLSYKTVANTCGRIKAKLGVRRTADLIRLSVQNQAL